MLVLSAVLIINYKTTIFFLKLFLPKPLKFLLMHQNLRVLVWQLNNLFQFQINSTIEDGKLCSQISAYGNRF